MGTLLAEVNRPLAFTICQLTILPFHFPRREQMKMQLVGSGQVVKEKDFFCKSDFDQVEATVRGNFDPRIEANPQVWI